MTRVRLDDTLTFRAWPDALVEANGHHARSPYVEAFWLPILGPSSLALLRRCGLELAVATEWAVAAEELGQLIGVHHNAGANSKLVRVVTRLTQFGAMRGGPSQFDVRTHLDTLTSGKIARLPLSAQAVHQQAVGR